MDSAISTLEKIEKRVTKSVGAYARCMKPDKSFYNNAKMLLKDEMIKWFLTANKFNDGGVRIMKAERLAVFEFTSTNGFNIGDMHVNENEMVLTDIYCPLERQLKINGKYLEEYKTKIESTYGFMDIYQVEL